MKGLKKIKQNRIIFKPLKRCEKEKIFKVGTKDMLPREQGEKL